VKSLVREAAQYLTALGRAEAAGGTSLDLSGSGIDARLERLRSELFSVVASDHDDDEDVRALVERLVEDGRKGLMRLAADGEAADISRPDLRTALEVIVREDGSRPAFQIVNGRPRPGADPNDPWFVRLSTRPEVAKAIAAVGRIDEPASLGPGYHGTGFLATPDLVITNRHVAQLIAPIASSQQVTAGVVPVRAGCFFDHGHEFGGIESSGRRPILAVVFTGPTPIDPFNLDHSRLDLAVLRLGGSVDPDGAAAAPLAIGVNPFLTDRQEQVVVIGYPARPSANALAQLDDGAKALALIYRNRFGYKRAAPGEIVRSPGETTEDTRKWRVDHDASTLGGNSGSCVIDLEYAPQVTALHYGGNWSGGPAVRINWAHALRNTLDEPGLAGLKYRTLRDVVAAEGIELVDVPQTH
jgi:hypothetical protein